MTDLPMVCRSKKKERTKQAVAIIDSSETCGDKSQIMLI